MFRSLSILMVVAILAITGFQVFWLRENYLKEKRNLDFRSNVIFKETVRRLQTKKLNLDGVFTDSLNNLKIQVMEPEGRGMMPGHPEELANILNDVTVRVKDSFSNTKTRSTKKPGLIISSSERLPDTSVGFFSRRNNVVVSLDKSFTQDEKDSLKKFTFERKGPPGEIFRFLYNVDSLQDSLRVADIYTACRKSFDKEELNIPIFITRDTNDVRIERLPPDDPKSMNRITLGFAHPITYKMNLGNPVGYLFKKLTSPILFSLFLVGVTVLSFLLLYRSLQRQRRLAEIKNEFISNITHELKTPIATVGVAIEALRNFNAINDPERTKEYLDISQNELHRLSLLVDKVLKLSMFEKKEIDLKYEYFDLKDLVDEVVSSMKLQIEKYHATVSVHTDGNTSLQGDKLHLLSVVFNLLDNALKYGNGNIAVKFSLKEKGEQLELSVSDNGIGIPTEYKEKVFEKFFRVPAGDTHNTKGYGLGLSYVAHVIQKHNGKIEVESQQGLGTKFIITLPKQPA